MQIAVFPPHELPTALGAVRALEPGSSPVRDRFVRAVATMHGVAVDPSVLPSPSFAETASVITDPVRRKRLVQLAVVSTLLGGGLASVLETTVAQLCKALGVDEAAIRAGRAMVTAGFDQR